MDVHLMVLHPETHIESFAKAGADILTVHQEACQHLNRVIQMIHDAGMQAGVAINPATPVKMIEDIISEVDLVLIMTVNPGWGGQKFIKNSISKISQVRKMVDDANLDTHIEVDGGIDDKTVNEASKAGANVFVSGTYIFRHSSYKEAIESLRK